VFTWLLIQLTTELCDIFDPVLFLKSISRVAILITAFSSFCLCLYSASSWCFYFEARQRLTSTVLLGVRSARFTELTSSIERELVVALDGPDAGSESDDTDWPSAGAAIVVRSTKSTASDFDVASLGRDFWLLDFRCTLFMMLEFFLSGVGNPAVFIALGTEIKPSEAATSCAAMCSFVSLSFANAFFDMLVGLLNSFKPLGGGLLVVALLQDTGFVRMTENPKFGRGTKIDPQIAI